MIVKIFSLILAFSAAKLKKRQSNLVEFRKFKSSTLTLLKEAEYDEPIEENAIVLSG